MMLLGTRLQPEERNIDDVTGGENERIADNVLGGGATIRGEKR